MLLDLYQVDAFTDTVFRGNPAAVVPLLQWLPDHVMQSIALENNLSETVFFVPHTGADADFSIRWFTPETEVDLCGHATLAAAFVIRQQNMVEGNLIRLSSQSGPLTVECSDNDDWLTLDFPARPPEQVSPDSAVIAALGIPVKNMALSRDLIAEVESEEILRSCTPDFAALRKTEYFGISLTAASGQNGIDFVSRFFAPGEGIDEDPVTGSSFCSLAPYWADKLGSDNLIAWQASARGGMVRLKNEPDTQRVKISGQARLYMNGQITIPDELIRE